MATPAWGQKTPGNYDHLEYRCAMQDRWLQKQFNLICQGCRVLSPPNSGRCNKCGSKNLIRDIVSWYEILELYEGKEDAESADDREVDL